jgi:hypothetical protein
MVRKYVTAVVSSAIAITTIAWASQCQTLTCPGKWSPAGSGCQDLNGVTSMVAFNPPSFRQPCQLPYFTNCKKCVNSNVQVTETVIQYNASYNGPNSCQGEIVSTNITHPYYQSSKAVLC